MTIISAGKDSSKYNIHITGKNLPKSVLNRNLGKKNKILIITDSGVPKKHIKKLKESINNKSVHTLVPVSYTHLTLPTILLV